MRRFSPQVCVAEKRGLPGVPVVFVGYGYIFCFVDCPMGNLLDIQYNDAYTERIILCFTGYPLSIHYNSNLRTTGSQMAKLSKTWMCAAVAQMGGTNERRALYIQDSCGESIPCAKSQIGLLFRRV